MTLHHLLPLHTSHAFSRDDDNDDDDSNDSTAVVMMMMTMVQTVRWVMGRAPSTGNDINKGKIIACTEWHLR